MRQAQEHYPAGDSPQMIPVHEKDLQRQQAEVKEQRTALEAARTNLRMGGTARAAAQSVGHAIKKPRRKSRQRVSNWRKPSFAARSMGSSGNAISSQEAWCGAMPPILPCSSFTT